LDMKPRPARRRSIENLYVVVYPIISFHRINHAPQWLKDFSKQTFASTVNVVCFWLRNHSRALSLGSPFE